MISTPSIFSCTANIVSGFTSRGFVAPTKREVKKAPRKLGDLLGFNDVASAQQVHGNRVVVVSGVDHVQNCDGLVATEANLLLTVRSADCALVLLADVINGVIGACHSGWRGTVQNIATETVTVMEDAGAEPGQIKAYVSPCISAEKFEVGEEVAEQFDSAFVLRPDGSAKPYVDLKQVVLSQLVLAGLGPENIELDAGCTVSNLNRYYSYRAEKGTNGRMFGFIGMRNP